MKPYDFNEIIKSFAPLKDIQPTHCLDLMIAMRKGLKERKVEVLETHYVNSGLISKIKDIDGQIYEIEIKALKK